MRHELVHYDRHYWRYLHHSFNTVGCAFSGGKPCTIFDRSEKEGFYNFNCEDDVSIVVRMVEVFQWGA